MPKFLFESSRRQYEESRKRAAETRRQRRLERQDPEIEEYKNVLRGLISKVNSAARRLQNYYAETGHLSPALETLENSGGLLRMKQTKNELLNEIMRGQMFLDDPTHTVRGAKEFFSKIATQEDLWKIFSKLQQLRPEIGTEQKLKYVIRDEIQALINEERYTVEEIEQIMIERLDDLIEEAQQDAAGMKGFWR